MVYINARYKNMIIQNWNFKNVDWLLLEGLFNFWNNCIWQLIIPIRPRIILNHFKDIKIYILIIITLN
jgi:hypothetical protein